MNIHKNARLTLLRRELMALAVIAGGLSKAYAARLYSVSAKVVSRSVERYEAEGRAVMVYRSSRPGHMPRATEATTVERIVALRRYRFTGKHIAQSGRRQPRHRQPGAEPRCTVAAQGPRTCRARCPL